MTPVTPKEIAAAKAICRERCAFLGEPPCWSVEGEPWPPELCDEPGCLALARAAVAEMRQAMTEIEWLAFERGIRFVIERSECYKRGDGPAETQFGAYRIHMVHCPASDITAGSAEHREKRVKAMMFIARNEP